MGIRIGSISKDFGGIGFSQKFLALSLASHWLQQLSGGTRHAIGTDHCMENTYTECEQCSWAVYYYKFHNKMQVYGYKERNVGRLARGMDSTYRTLTSMHYISLIMTHTYT